MGGRDQDDNYAVSFAAGRAEVTSCCWRALTSRDGRIKCRAGQRLGLAREISVTLQGGPADSVENIFGLKAYYKDCWMAV